MVEKFDFSSGTSSRSTKLIHGGVRYLQKAIMQFDIEQYRMVKEALAERANLINIAPHLAYPLPIMIPVYKLVRCQLKNKFLLFDEHQIMFNVFVSVFEAVRCVNNHVIAMQILAVAVLLVRY